MTSRRSFSLGGGLGTVAGMTTRDPGEGCRTRGRSRQLVADGTIGWNDRVERLAGVIVALSPLLHVAIAVADVLPPRPS